MHIVLNAKQTERQMIGACLPLQTCIWKCLGDPRIYVEDACGRSDLMWSGVV